MQLLLFPSKRAGTALQCWCSLGKRGREVQKQFSGSLCVLRLVTIPPKSKCRVVLSFYAIKLSFSFVFLERRGLKPDPISSTIFGRFWVLLCMLEAGFAVLLLKLGFSMGWKLPAGNSFFCPLKNHFLSFSHRKSRQGIFVPATRMPSWN